MDKKIKIKKPDNKEQDKDNKNKDDNPKTYTEKLTKTEIAELLIDYEKIKNIDDLEDLPLGTHIRYFDIENDVPKFRIGGDLMVKKTLPEYIILSAGKNFSVQTKNKVFFRKISNEEVKKEYDKLLSAKDKKLIEKEHEINELQSLIKQFKKEKVQLEFLIKKLKNK